MNRIRPLPHIVLAATLALTACKRDQPAAAGNGSPAPSASAATDARSPPPGATNADARAGEPSGSAAPLDPPAPAGEFREAGAVLPQGEVGGWRQSGPVTRSTAANLSQIMDGAAALYESYGVRNYAKTEYRRPGTSLVATVEVYEFAAPLGAFGRYSRMVADGRDPASLQSQAANRGGGGYQGSTQLTFWKGAHLVQVSVADSSDEPNEQAVFRAAREVLPAFGEALERRIPGTTNLPESPLPTDGLVWGGRTYFPDQVFGIERTGPAWVGHYQTADAKRYRLAVFAMTSAADASRVFTQLRSAAATPVAGLGDAAFAQQAEATGELVAMRRGNTVYALADGGAPGMQALTRDGKIAALRALTTGAAPAAPTPAAPTPAAPAPAAPAAH